MRLSVLCLAVALLAIFAGSVSACPYNQAVVVQQVVATPVVAAVPVQTVVATPVVQSQVAVVPTAVFATPVVQTFAVQQNVYGGFGGQRAVRGRAVGGGGGGLGGVVNAVNNLANSPAGIFTIGALAGGGTFRGAFR